VAGVFEDLEADPLQQGLRLHSLSGELAGFCAVWVTQAYRILLELNESKSEIILHNIGTHDEVYR
jgi:mRNA-degrading endonuclease YafQ of YafQ-DinJ toxin-antitoxin module